MLTLATIMMSLCHSSVSAWGAVIDRSYVSHVQHKNWPRCRPFMRHAINEDVPSNRRGLVTRGYWAWIFAAAGFCADWLTITLM